MHLLVAAHPPADEDGGGDALGGELVVLALPDVDPRRGAFDHDDACAVRQQPDHFVGVDSHAAVERVEVVDLDVSPQLAMQLVIESLARREHRTGDALAMVGARLTAEMLSIAGQFPVGTVLRLAGAVLHAHVPLPDGAGGRRPVCDEGSGGSVADRPGP